MRRQVRPYLAVVANGFARRVGVELAGPVCCLIPAGGMQMGVPESGLALSSWLDILVGSGLSRTVIGNDIATGIMMAPYL